MSLTQAVEDYLLPLLSFSLGMATFREGFGVCCFENIVMSVERYP